MTTALLPAHDEERCRFVLTLPEGEAVLEYELAGAVLEAEAGKTTVLFTHTFVPEALRGRGVAAELVRAGLKWAQACDYHVEARCSYVVSYLEAHPAKKA